MSSSCPEMAPSSCSSSTHSSGLGKDLLDEVDEGKQKDSKEGWADCKGEQADHEGEWADRKGEQADHKGEWVDRKDERADCKGKQEDGKGKQTDGKGKRTDGKGKWTGCEGALAGSKGVQVPDGLANWFSQRGRPEHSVSIDPDWSNQIS
ncbi:hypothetical protein BS47DRAFT_1396655 [Hydnum rufescens UP504]|uniref:Uncharacterized protein n=1 Tax=Hydnum rufescens UP504 TaxID=1448309 RepID=A0A9P6APK3_9AGAM|nr:hypothetical protein BS47DRAFT_1396655 [Hydnum rufescens UP504]